MNEDLHGFLKDLFILIQEKYNESLAEAGAPAPEAEAAYWRGANFAYYDVLDLIRSQLIAFGYVEATSEFVTPELGKPAHTAA
jgi:hypothetical protein